MIPQLNTQLRNEIRLQGLLALDSEKILHDVWKLNGSVILGVEVIEKIIQE